MKYKVTTNTIDITENTTIRPDKRFGGWLAVNTGTADATVDGYPLSPGDGLDMTHIRPEIVWGSAIAIVLQSGAKIRFTRLIYSELK